MEREGDHHLSCQHFVACQKGDILLYYPMLPWCTFQYWNVFPLTLVDFGNTFIAEQNSRLIYYLDEFRWFSLFLCNMVLRLVIILRTYFFVKTRLLFSYVVTLHFKCRYHLSIYTLSIQEYFANFQEKLLLRGLFITMLMISWANRKFVFNKFA